MNGTIKTLVSDRFFGFISYEGAEKDVFFHKDALNGVTFEELKEGDKVSFEIVEGQNGKSAAANVARA